MEDGVKSWPAFERSVISGITPRRVIPTLSVEREILMRPPLEHPTQRVIRRSAGVLGLARATQTAPTLSSSQDRSSVMCGDAHGLSGSS